MVDLVFLNLELIRVAVESFVKLNYIYLSQLFLGSSVGRAVDC